MKQQKKNWVSPSVESLSVKAFTLSGCVPEINEGIDTGQTYMPENSMRPDCNDGPGGSS